MLKSMFKTTLCISAATLGFSMPTAQADVIGFTTSQANFNDCAAMAPNRSCDIVSGLDIPNPVAANPNVGELLVWNEQTVTLASDLFIDAAGTPLPDVVSSVMGGFEIAAGTTISSHMIQWDSVANNFLRARTAIEFESQIIGFITSSSTLAATDVLLGVPGYTYDAMFNGRGLELNEDSIQIGGDAFTADIIFRAGLNGNGDWARVITIDVPEPSSLAIMGLGLVGFSLSRKRFSRQAP